MLSRDDIFLAIANGNLKIFPFEPKSLTGIGYNLSTTDFAFSINQGVLLTIHHEMTSDGFRRYVTIPCNDTVLFFSKEYIEVDNSLAGTFHSKVSRVCEGIGSISSTLDATWRGQLLISISNPTSRSIRFDLDKSSGNVMTLLLHRLDTPVTGDNIHDNNKGRCELLLAHFATVPSNSVLREKHFLLKDFVQNELADSLNGHDCFLTQDYPHDQYSDLINNMFKLRKRLNSDLISIREGTYHLGVTGKYSCLKNNKEVQLIKGCTLYKIALHKVTVESDSLKNEFALDELENAPKTINKLIEAIDYELEMIDHVRRIKWHNDRVSEFASEDSELVRLRTKKTRIRKIISFILLSCLTIIFLALGIFLLVKSDSPGGIKGLLSTAITYFAAILPSMFLFWRWYFVGKGNSLDS